MSEKDYAMLYQIPGVEIFAAGKWNGDEYSEQDLDEMVKAFEENKATIKPYLKLGHSDHQTLLQNDGFPAAGWIGNIYRQGKKLLADFVDIPEKIYQLISNKAYRKVSSEIYWNINVNGKKYPRMLAACALLGTDLPAVSSLNDILSMYGIKDFDFLKSYIENETEIKNYELVKEDTMSEELKKLETDLEKANETIETIKKEFTQKESEKDAKIAELEAVKKEYTDKLEKEAEENRKLKLEKDIKEIEDTCKTCPSMKDYITEILSDKKEYKINEQSFEKKDLLKEMLKLYSESLKVNFDNSSLKGDEEHKEDEVQKMNKLMEEKKLSPKEAYKTIIKE